MDNYHALYGHLPALIHLYLGRSTESSEAQQWMMECDEVIHLYNDFKRAQQHMKQQVDKHCRGVELQIG